MAIYHLSAKILSRAQGHSAVSAAAYRAGVRLTDERTSKTHDYRRKRGCDAAFIVLPEGSPSWAADRATLWNRAEAAEKRRDAQVAREVNLALPRELTPEAARTLVERFAAEQFAARGMVVDVALHHLSGPNPHAHLLLTTRTLARAPQFSRKNREWNEHSMLLAVRAAWAELANAALFAQGQRARIDHRSLSEQQAAAMGCRDMRSVARLDREPTRHTGNARAPLSRRRTAENARIAARNAARANTWARVLAAPAPAPAWRPAPLPVGLVRALRAHHGPTAPGGIAGAGVLALLARSKALRLDETAEALPRARGAHALREALAAALAEARQARPTRRTRGPR